MVLEFNLKFFFVAIVVSLVAGIFYHLNIWLLNVYKLPMEIYSWIAMGLAPVQLVAGVVLPFVVMYMLGTRIGSEIIKSAIVSTFLGCWIGGISIFAVNTCLLYSSGGMYGQGSILQLAVYIIWEVFATSLSAVFFISLAAILFAYYRKTMDR